ncbi:YggT family protein [Candidatus Gracilibacteria bacterium]|nr:YggT family protein [Candidatus Gracilibacteria bacterium]
MIWFIFGVIDVLLGLRFVFLLLGANNVGIVNFLYKITGLFVAPFNDVFESPSFGESFFDSASLVGIILYSLLAYGITKLISIFFTKGALSLVIS